MAQQNQSEIQNGAGTQPSYRDSHTAAAVDIQPGLRTVGAIIDFDAPTRCGGKLHDGCGRPELA
jgi:hypothetical protein